MVTSRLPRSPEAQRHDRGADAGAHVDGAVGAVAVLWIARRAAAVEAVDVLVAADLPEGDLVQARERHLTAVGVAGEHERHAVVPQPSASSAMCERPRMGMSCRSPLTASSRRAWPV
jgi:hypothetical protein